MTARTIGVLISLSGCGRIGFNAGQSSDAAVDVAIDAEVRLLETLVVSSDATPVVSTLILAGGVTYQLRVSGTFEIGGGTDPFADADYWDFGAGAKDLCDDMFTDAGLSIDDPLIDGDKFPKWGPYRADHVYMIDFVGKAASISARIHDVAPGNNIGSLTLQIFGP